MNILINYQDFKNLFPHITDFEFDLTLAKIGLKYKEMVTPDTNRIMFMHEYRYKFEVIDEKLFMLHTIKTGVTLTVVE
jgi:hypothetical protein